MFVRGLFFFEKLGVIFNMMVDEKYKFFVGVFEKVCDIFKFFFW